MSGGLLGAFSSTISGITNPLSRYVADTVGETVIDTITDSAQGGNVTLASVGTSLVINAVSEGISSRTVKGPKADVQTNKPKSGDVPVTKPIKDVTPVQQLALPGPTSKPLALPAPQSTPKTDFYVTPDGNTIQATSPYAYLMDGSSVGEGKVFTASQKSKILEENRIKNGGVVCSDLSGTILSPAQKSQLGVTPDPNEWQIDHIIPRSKGGTNSFSNAQVLSRTENRLKSDQ